MPGIKIHPPAQLPEQSISQQQFEDWTNELEIYLGQDEAMARFMDGGIYQRWTSQEANPDRIVELSADDPNTPRENADNRDAVLAELLAKRRRELRTFIGLVAKCAAKNMYAGIVRHATSLQWVYDKIREEYDIQTKGIHFLNIIDLKYDPETKTPAGFYNEFRTVILNNIGRAGEVIQHNGNRALPADEVVGPLFEDLILLNVLQLIDPRLPRFVKKHYQLKMGERRLTDLKSDIFTNLKQFLTEMEAEEQLASMNLSAMSTTSETPSLAAFTYRGARGRPRGRARASTRPPTQRRTFCKTCYEGEKGRSTYLSHNSEEYNCPSKVKLNALADEILPPEVLEYEQEIEESGSDNAQDC